MIMKDGSEYRSSVIEISVMSVRRAGTTLSHREFGAEIRYGHGKGQLIPALKENPSAVTEANTEPDTGKSSRNGHGVDIEMNAVGEASSNADKTVANTHQTVGNSDETVANTQAEGIHFTWLDQIRWPSTHTQDKTIEATANDKKTASQGGSCIQTFAFTYMPCNALGLSLWRPRVGGVEGGDWNKDSLGEAHIRITPCTDDPITERS